MDRRTATAVLLLVALATVLGFFRLGATPLVDPDEGRYASAAAGMLKTGDWIVPRFNGEPRLNKPPLAYWLQALAMKALGRGELAARLPSALAGLTVVLALLLHGYRRGERGVGLLAALVVLTAPLAFGGFHLAVPDALLAMITTVALLMALEVHEGRLALWPGSVLAATALGLAFLTKGHVPLGVFLSVEIGYLALRWKRVRLAPAPFLLGLGLILVMAAPWVVGVVFRIGWEPLREIVASEVARLGSGSAHPEPWHYYLWRYPLVLLPWTGFFLVALPAAWRRRHEPAVALALSWAFAPIVLFSASSGKNNLYLLPALPGAALLVGLTWAGRGAEGALADRRRLLPAALLAALLAVASAAFVLTHHSSRDVVAGHRTLVVVSTAAFCVVVATLASLRRGVALITALATVTAALLTGGLVAGPEVLAHGRSTRALAEAYRAQAGEGDDIVFYRTDAGQHASLVFYLDRPVRAAWRTRELRAVRREKSRMYLVTGDDDHARLVRGEIERWEGPLARTRELALYREVSRPGVAGLDDLVIDVD